MDLDNEEIEATRNLKVYGSDIDIGSIDEAIKILEKFKNNEIHRDKLEVDNKRIFNLLLGR